MTTIYATVNATPGVYDARCIWIDHMVGSKFPTIFLNLDNRISIVGIDGAGFDQFDNGTRGFLDELYSSLIRATTVTLGTDDYGVPALTLDGGKHPVVYRIRSL